MAEIEKITAEKAQNLIQKESPVVLDFRTPGEFEQGHIDGAMNINFFSENFSQQLDSLNREKTYLVHCRTMNRTVPAAGMMYQMGFRHIYVLDGGIIAWEHADLPLV